MEEEKEIMNKQIQLIEELIGLAMETQKEKKDYIKSLKNICITIILTFALIIISFYILYFNNSYDKEIEAVNSNHNINKNYNITQEE